MFRSPFPASLSRQIIVSVQAPPADPLDHIDTLRRIAIAVLRGGAGGLRSNGVESTQTFRAETTLPILGIQKRSVGGTLCITPDFEAAQAIARAGADVIALDCSVARSTQAEPWPELITHIHTELQKPVLADIATIEEALAAEARGVDAVATTLYGFTPQTSGACTVNWEMVAALVSKLRVPLIVEGHISQPDEVRRAFELGVFSVVIGSAITRPESITARFVSAIV